MVHPDMSHGTESFARHADQASRLAGSSSVERFSAVAAVTRGMAGMRNGMVGGSLVGKTIESAGLRGLPDVFLVAIERANGTMLHAVPPTEVLESGDVLWFAGGTNAVISLRKVPGMQLAGSCTTRRDVGNIVSRVIGVSLFGSFTGMKFHWNEISLKLNVTGIKTGGNLAQRCFTDWLTAAGKTD